MCVSVGAYDGKLIRRRIVTGKDIDTTLHATIVPTVRMTMRLDTDTDINALDATDMMTTNPKTAHGRMKTS
jgi:hypothetical protein